MKLARAAFLLVVAATAATALSAIPTFTLDLARDPSTRWRGAVKAVVDAHTWEYSFGGVYALYGLAFDVIDKLVPGIPNALEAHLAANFPSNYAEINAIAAEMASLGHPEINATMLASLAYFYEVAHTRELRASLPPGLYKACTGILTLPTDASLPILHGRNMDEQPAAGRNCTLHIRAINSTKGGNATEFEMVDWMWATSGVYTGFRKNAVTLEMNWRNRGPAESLVEIFNRLLHTPNTWPTVFAYRHILQSGMDYDQARATFLTSTFAAPFYVIMSGTQRRGAVLTIAFNRTANNAQFLSDANLTAAAAGFRTSFMVQTNYDRWLPDPTSDPRRTVAEDVLHNIESADRRGTELGVWMALGTYPVHNPMTMFTVLMSVGYDSIEGYARRQMLPKDGPRY